MRIRPRRLRQTQAFRDLVSEHTLRPEDLIYPVFIHEDEKSVEIDSMPGQKRLSPSDLLSVAEKAEKLKIAGLALFPVIDSKLKTPNGDEALNSDGFLPKTVRLLKSKHPNLTIITDIALDPYTSHGQDGILNENGDVDNDLTVNTLTQQSICHAGAGADIVAPSDMMDGRIGAIRDALETAGYINTAILSYAAKYASCFYGPFRDAVGSASNLGSADKRTYQMDPPNTEEAIKEVALDLDQGADMVMVKPGLPYLDIVHRVKSEFGCPTLVYQVSGEYSMMSAAFEKNWLDREKTIMESLICFKRSGADGIFTYFAIEAAEILLRGSK